MYVADIFLLLLPGIDLNDPTKTGLSCMAISNIIDCIRVGDVSEVDEEAAKAARPGVRALREAPRVQLEEDLEEATNTELQDLSPDDVNARVRLSTAVFRDWLPEFLGRVLLLFANLPEEGGKSGRAGGKLEQITLQSVLVSSCVNETADDSTPAVRSSALLTIRSSTLRSNKSPSTPPQLVVPMQWKLSAS